MNYPAACATAIGVGGLLGGLDVDVRTTSLSGIGSSRGGDCVWLEVAAIATTRLIAGRHLAARDTLWPID